MHNNRKQSQTIPCKGSQWEIIGNHNKWDNLTFPQMTEGYPKMLADVQRFPETSRDVQIYPNIHSVSLDFDKYPRISQVCIYIYIYIDVKIWRHKMWKDFSNRISPHMFWYILICLHISYDILRWHVVMSCYKFVDLFVCLMTPPVWKKYKLAIGGYTVIEDIWLKSDYKLSSIITGYHRLS